MVSGCGNERRVMFGAGLEDGLVFELPWLVDQQPIGMVAQNSTRRFEIGQKIGAKIKVSVLPCPAGDGLQKVGLHDPVFVVAEFWPWIRKKNVDR